jgi:DNA-binding PadR family transcriptional regulator
VARRPTLTEYAVLGLLSMGEKSGYDVWRFAERSVGFLWAPAKSQVYKVLPRLAELGLATVREVEQAGRPDKQLYAITAAGRRALAGWLEQVDAGATPDQIQLRIFFAGQGSPDAAVRQVEAYRDVVAARLERWRELEPRIRDAPGQRFPHRVLVQGIRSAEVDLAWAEELLAELRRPDAGRTRRAG